MTQKDIYRYFELKGFVEGVWYAAQDSQNTQFFEALSQEYVKLKKMFDENPTPEMDTSKKEGSSNAI